MTTLPRISGPLDDADRIAPILRHLRHASDDDTFSRRLQDALYAGYRVLIAERDDDAIGCLGFQVHHDVHWGRTFYIDDIVVHPRARGLGIGSALMSAATKLARETGCDHLRLASGLDRADAHRFYESHGMTRSSFQFARALTDGDR